MNVPPDQAVESLADPTAVSTSGAASDLGAATALPGPAASASTPQLREGDSELQPKAVATEPAVVLDAAEAESQKQADAGGPHRQSRAG